jgi:hypothetical protein
MLAADHTTGGDADKWDEVARRLCPRIATRVSRQISPSSDVWDQWSVEALKSPNGPNPYYMPSVGGGLVFGTRQGFSYENETETEWRLASNRMKRESDLWKHRADSYADAWGHWCSARGMPSAREIFHQLSSRVNESINRRARENNGSQE